MCEEGGGGTAGGCGPLGLPLYQTSSPPHSPLSILPLPSPPPAPHPELTQGLASLGHIPSPTTGWWDAVFTALRHKMPTDRVPAPALVG